MRQIQRLQEIYKILKKGKVNSDEIISNLQENGVEISRRQLQRDFIEIPPFIKETESLITTTNSKRIKSYQIINSSKSKKTKELDSVIKSTHFQEAKVNISSYYIVDNLIKAIKNNYTILIKKLSYDFTDDNHSFTQRTIQFKPIEILLHKGTHYIGGYNIGKKIIQIFEVNQLKEIEFIKHPIFYPNLNEKLNQELETRFGITKNINRKTYNIKLEFSTVTGNFIMNNFWHNSQCFKVHKGKITMELHCGINSELIGWLMYWLYNVRILEPPILLEYYNKAIEEINLINTNKKTLIHRNIFNKEK